MVACNYAPLRRSDRVAVRTRPGPVPSDQRSAWLQATALHRRKGRRVIACNHGTLTATRDGTCKNPSVNHSPTAATGWPFPLELVPARRDPLDGRRTAQLVWFFLRAGHRLAGFAATSSNFPLSEDECFLSANLLDGSYVGLMGGLKYEQVCPLGFLWIQLTVVKLLGFHRVHVAAVLLVCGVGGLFVFRHLAGRLLKGPH